MVAPNVDPIACYPDAFQRHSVRWIADEPTRWNRLNDSKRMGYSVPTADETMQSMFSLLAMTQSQFWTRWRTRDCSPATFRWFRPNSRCWHLDSFPATIACNIWHATNRHCSRPRRNWNRTMWWLLMRWWIWFASTYLQPMSSSVTRPPSTIVNPPMPGRTIFFNISVPSAVTFTRHNCAASRSDCPCSPHNLHNNRKTNNLIRSFRWGLDFAYLIWRSYFLFFSDNSGESAGDDIFCAFLQPKSK